MSEDTKKEKVMVVDEEKSLSDVTKKAAFKAPKKKAAPKKAAKKAAPKKAAVKPSRRYSFEQWASRRGVKAHHRGGLRAFIKNPDKPRTLEDWDACFKGY